MSTKPLQEYFDTLSAFAERSYEKLNKSSGLDLDKVKALYEAGFVSGYDATTMDAGFALINASITPPGAVVLAEWNTLLERASLRGRVLSALEKLLWVTVGVVASVIGQLIA
jgi:hypothetical protein